MDAWSNIDAVEAAVVAGHMLL